MDNYDDIRHLPHHQSASRPHMSLHDRAAQFAPFAALTGYDDMVRETARLTDRRPELSEEENAELDRSMREIVSALRSGAHPQIRVRYFIPDEHKAGGQYAWYEGSVRGIDTVARRIIFYADNGISAGTEIRIDQILELIPG